MTKFITLALSALLTIPAIAGAQTATPAAQLGWDQTAANLATASGYSYKYYPDGAATGTALSGVTCSGAASPFPCLTAFPAFTPGSHTLTLTASNVAGESAKSTVLSFTFVVVPSAPASPRIVQLLNPATWLGGSREGTLVLTAVRVGDGDWQPLLRVARVRVKRT